MKIVSIFHTLDGEVTEGGPLQWSVFIRLGGCNLRCWKSTGFCDAPASLDLHYPYPELTPPQVMDAVRKFYPCRRVTITGGEPLLQKKELSELVKLLKESRYTTTLETSGSKPVQFHNSMHYLSCIIMDVKCPSTEMSHLNLPENMSWLRAKDYVKFVIQDKEDYKWAKEYIVEHSTKAKIAFGPRYNYLHPHELIEWLRKDKLFHIQLNLQMHKYIWAECHPPEVKSLKEVDFKKSVELER